VDGNDGELMDSGQDWDEVIVGGGGGFTSGREMTADFKSFDCCQTRVT